MTSNVHIKLKDTPNMPADSDIFSFRLLTEEEKLERAEYVVSPNQDAIYSDPFNYFVFDPGTTSSSNFFEPGTGGDNYFTKEPRIFTGVENHYMGVGKFNYGTNRTYYFYDGQYLETNLNGGPRNKGFCNINKTMVLLNDNITRGSVNDPSNNEIWKTGSIQLTIKPEADNRVILSGALDGQAVASVFGIGSKFYSGGQFGGSYRANAISDSDYQAESFVPFNPQEEDATLTSSTVYVYDSSGLGGPVLIGNPNYEDGITLSDSSSIPRYFELSIHDGKLKIVYEVFYGSARRKTTVIGNTNILDNNWHHVVINRPTKNTKTSNGNLIGQNGAIEIWVDGKLDIRSYEINSNDVMPMPHLLFNSIINPGFLSLNLTPTRLIDLSIIPDFDKNTYSPFNADQKFALEQTNYVGGIRDYIFMINAPLSNHEIDLFYTYALKSAENDKICKSNKLTATASFKDPVITTNSKKVVKLFWNNLINDPAKNIDGVELDNSFSVKSYSVTNKNLISPTETFNLNIAGENKQRIYTDNVKTAIETNVQILKPGIVLNIVGEDVLTNSGFDFGFPQDPVPRDVMNEQDIIWRTDSSPWVVNNMQYGGIELKENDRILLIGQHKQSQNGIYIFNGPNKPLTRPENVTKDILKNLHVYVEEGNSKGKTFVQINEITHTRKSPQKWIPVDTESSIYTFNSYPVYLEPWSNNNGEPRFIDVNSDIDLDYDIIVFMNYPTNNSDIVNALNYTNENYNKEKYKEFINNLKIAISNGKSLYISSPQLAVDLGIVSGYQEIPQLFDESGDAQSASISPFENNEPAENYFDTHRNMKYQLVTELPGLTDKETYIMTDFVTYSPDRQNSDYHIKYSYRQFGIQEGDEFYIPGLTTLPETQNNNLPSYKFNQRGTNNIIGFTANQILLGTPITELSNTIYDGDTPVNNPYDDYVTTIAVNYGNGKIFVNCVEDGYAFSREDYNKAIIQNVTIGQNSETALTAAWQYSTKRIKRKNLYEFSEDTNVIGQTVPTNGGGGGIVQGQSHSSNGMIRNVINKDDIRYQSDLYAEADEEFFATTEIPVLSMTWLGLQWLAE